jgi:hypothetical protein
LYNLLSATADMSTADSTPDKTYIIDMLLRAPPELMRQVAIAAQVDGFEKQ